MREYQNKSLEKAMSILDCFTRENKELTASEISKMLNLNLSSIYPLLSTLEKSKYLIRDENGKFSLGIKFVVKGNLVLAGLNLIEISRAHLQSLAREFHGNSHLAILNNNRALIVDRSLASDRVFINSIIGYEIPLYCTSLGKVLLAFQSSDMIQEYINSTEFRRFTPSTHINKQNIFENLEEIKLRGYGVSNEEFTSGEICFAAPIFDGSGEIVASMNLALSKISIEKENEYYGIRVTQVARNISSLLGYMGPVLK